MAVGVGVGSEDVKVGSEVVGGIAGGVGHGGLGRTRVGNGGVADFADVDVANTVRDIVKHIEAGFWQVVGPEVVGSEVADAKYVCKQKCNVIDVGSSATIALHPIDTSATTTTTNNDDKRNNDTHT